MALRQRGDAEDDVEVRNATCGEELVSGCLQGPDLTGMPSPPAAVSSVHHLTPAWTEVSSLVSTASRRVYDEGVVRRRRVLRRGQQQAFIAIGLGKPFAEHLAAQIREAMTQPPLVSRVGSDFLV